MRRLLPLLLAAALPAAAALAAPRPGPAVLPAPRIPPFYDADARLAKPVTVRVPKSTLAKIAAELERQTGVRLRATADVADEPTILFAFDRPLKEVMHHLALLFDYRWNRIRSGDGPSAWRYELTQDRDSKAREQALRDADLAERMQAIQEQLRLCIRLAGESPDAVRREGEPLDAERERFLESHSQLLDGVRFLEASDSAVLVKVARAAFFYRLLQLPVPRALAKFADTLTPAQWAAVQEGDLLRFRTRVEEPGDLPLPPEIARALETGRPILTPLMPAGTSVGADLQATMQKEEQRSQDDWSRATGYRVSVRLDPIMALEPSGVRQWLRLRIQAQPEGVAKAPTTGFNLAYNNDLYFEDPIWSSSDAAPIEASHPDRVPPEWMVDPLLGAKRPLKLQVPPDPWTGRSDASDVGEPAIRLRDLLPQIADTYRINLVADAYRCESYGISGAIPSYQPLAAGEEWPLYRALNRFALPTSRWTREGDFIHVRRHFWYYDRLAEIPERLAERYEAQYRRHPQPGLQDVAALALALRNAQLRDLAAVLAERGVWLGPVFRSQIADAYVSPPSGQREMLRAFGSVSPSQQSALLAGRALLGADLPLATRRWLRLALNERERVGEKDSSLPVLTPEVSLALLTLPVHRDVKPSSSGFSLDYRLAGARLPDNNGRTGERGVAVTNDFVPSAPGLVTPRPAATSEALFLLGWPDGTRVTWGVIVPRADLRAPANSAPRG